MGDHSGALPLLLGHQGQTTTRFSETSGRSALVSPGLPNTTWPKKHFGIPLLSVRSVLLGFQIRQFFDRASSVVGGLSGPRRPYNPSNLDGARSRKRLKGIPKWFLWPSVFWRPGAPRPQDHAFFRNEWSFGLGTPGLQKTTWPNKHCGIPLLSVRSVLLGFQIRPFF